MPPFGVIVIQPFRLGKRVAGMKWERFGEDAMTQWVIAVPVCHCALGRGPCWLIPQLTVRKRTVQNRC